MTPGRLTIILLSALALLSIVPSMQNLWWPVWFVLLGAFVVMLFIDCFQLWHVTLVARRVAPRIVAHQQKTTISVTIENNSGQLLYLEVHDGHPAHCEVEQQPNTVSILPNAEVTFHYRLQSNQRGYLHFDGVHCRIQTRLGLLRRTLLIPESSEIKVFPNFQANRLFGLLLHRHSLSAMGVKQRQHQGEGSDFHQLREFRDGDSLRHIDWKASSRLEKLISKEYQQERDQQIVFLLDCSMRMRHGGDGASHMDNALNAVVLLAHVALRQGDATGLMTFGGIDRWLPPAKGQKAANRLVNGVFDIEATHEMPDYDSVVENLQKSLKRRALVILVTNLRNEDGDVALNALQRLSRKHLVLIADLRERDLDAVLHNETKDINDAVLWFSSESYQQERQHRHRLARAQGASLVDVLPEQLSGSLISEYLAIKNRGAL